MRVAALPRNCNVPRPRAEERLGEGRIALPRELITPVLRSRVAHARPAGRPAPPLTAALRRDVQHAGNPAPNHHSR